jgi:hypothetical protein
MQLSKVDHFILAKRSSLTLSTVAHTKLHLHLRFFKPLSPLKCQHRKYYNGCLGSLDGKSRTKLFSTFLRIGSATRTKEKFRLHLNYLYVNIILINYSIIAWNKSSLISEEYFTSHTKITTICKNI